MNDLEQTQQIDEALKLEELDLPEKPRVTGVRWEPYQDWSGDDSLRIWVILADETKDEELTGEAAQAMRRAVRGRLEAAGVYLFPYVRYALEREYEGISGRR